jgi:hypothetical protein
MEDRHTNVFSLKKKLPWHPVVMLFFCFEILRQMQNLFLLCGGPVGAKSRRATEPRSSRPGERLERSAALVYNCRPFLVTSPHVASHNPLCSVHVGFKTRGPSTSWITPPSELDLKKKLC